MFLSKKDTILTNALKDQITRSGLGYIHVNDQKNKRIKIGVGTSILYLVSHHFQELA